MLSILSSDQRKIMERELKKYKSDMDQGGQILLDDEQDEQHEQTNFENLPDELFVEIARNIDEPKDLYRFCSSSGSMWTKCQQFKRFFGQKQLELIFNVYTNDTEDQGGDNPHGDIRVLITYNKIDILQLLQVVYQIYTDVLELFGNAASNYAHLMTEIKGYSDEFFEMNTIIEDIFDTIRQHNDWPETLFIDVEIDFDTIQTIVRFSNVRWHQRGLGGDENHTFTLNLTQNEQWNADDLVLMRFENENVPQRLEEVARDFVGHMIQHAQDLDRNNGDDHE